MPPATILGLSATGLAIARVLGRRGIRVFGVDDRWWEIGRTSRYVETSQTLTDCMAFHGPLFAGGDPELSYLDRVLEDIDRHRGPRRDSVAMLDKVHQTHLYKPLMAHLGSALPATWTPSTWDDWREIQPGKTLILKPRFGGASKTRPTRGKLWRCSPELDPAVVAHAIGLEPDEVVVQEVVPGPDHAIEVCFLYRRQDGAFGSLMTGRKLRQRPRGFGSASYLVTTQAVELAALARRTV